MFGLIENLRNKSETYRHVVAISTALIVTLVLFGVWMTVLFPSAFTGQPVIAQNDQNRTPPFSLFTANAIASFGAMKAQWKSLTNSLSQTNYQSNNQIQIVSPEKDSVGVGQNQAN